MRLVSLLLGILAALAAIAGLVAVFVLLVVGGVVSAPAGVDRLLGRDGGQGGLMEVCGVTMAGSNTVGERLAPVLVADYLRSAGFALAQPRQERFGELVLVGRGEKHRCTVRIRSHGTSEAFEDMRQGKAEIGMASRAVTDAAIEALRAAGAGDLRADAAVAEHVIALDGVAVIVHPSNPVRNLRMADLRRVFRGEVRDWAQLGGLPGPIRLYARDDASGTYQFFRDRVLEGDENWKQRVPGARRFASSSELAEAVAGDTAGLGFVGLAYTTGRVRAAPVSDGGPAIRPTVAAIRSETYPISRRLFLYVRPDTMRDNPFVAALVRYFKSSAAFARVEELHYVSLRPGGAVAEEPEPTVCVAGTAEAAVYAKAIEGAQRLLGVLRFKPGATDFDALARDDAERIVEAAAQGLARGGQVVLIGHTDGDGEPERNRRIGLELAETVRTQLEQRGLLGLQVESGGEMCPVLDNASASGRLGNRRVEVWLR